MPTKIALSVEIVWTAFSEHRSPARRLQEAMLRGFLVQGQGFVVGCPPEPLSLADSSRTQMMPALCFVCGRDSLSPQN